MKLDLPSLEKLKLKMLTMENITICDKNTKLKRTFLKVNNYLKNRRNKC